jgi:hypothetical protein
MGHLEMLQALGISPPGSDKGSTSALVATRSGCNDGL